MTGRLIVLLAVLSAFGSASQMTSDFNDGTTQGWTVYSPFIGAPGGTGPVNVPSGGIGSSPYLQTEDTANGQLLFVAPSSWSGNYLDQFLTFSLRNQNPNTYRNQAYFGDPVVWIMGAGLTLYYYNDFSTPSSCEAPGADVTWTFNCVPLTPGPDWSLNEFAIAGGPAPTTAQMLAVFSDITAVYIDADWVTGYFGKPGDTAGHDITGLDDVTLGTPEPATIVLTGIGLAFALLGFRKRSRALPR